MKLHVIVPVSEYFSGKVDTADLSNLSSVVSELVKAGHTDIRITPVQEDNAIKVGSIVKIIARTKSHTIPIGTIVQVAIVDEKDNDLPFKGDISEVGPWFGRDECELVSAPTHNDLSSTTY